MALQQKHEAQDRFDKQYITSSEIMGELEISRSSILAARRTGRLPDAIFIHGQIYIWERDKIRPYLDAWKVVLNVRRGAHV